VWLVAGLLGAAAALVDLLACWAGGWLAWAGWKEMCRIFNKSNFHPLAEFLVELAKINK
jgi:hypothetical protein